MKNSTMPTGRGAASETEPARAAVGLEEALGWARTRVRMRRTRRGLIVAMVVVAAVVAGAALVGRVGTGTLILVTLVGLGLLVPGVLLVSRLMPVSRSSLVWLVDRAFGLQERLVTVGDCGATDRFRLLLSGEIEGRLTARFHRAASPPGSPWHARRVTRRLRRWRWHVALVFLVVLVLGVHALVTTPRLIARLPGESHRFVAGTPIPLQLAYRVGRDRLTGLRVVVDDRAALQLTEFTEILPGGNQQVDIHPYLRRSGRLTTGEHAVKVVGATPGGRDLASDPVVFTLEAPSGSVGQGSSGGESSSAGGAGGQGDENAAPGGPGSSPSNSNPSPNPKNDKAPSPVSSTEASAPNQTPRESEKPDPSSPPDPASPPPPTPSARTPRPGASENPPEAAPEPRSPSSDPPRPLGAPERTRVQTTPRFVMPLLDDRGRVVDKERWVLRHLPGGTQASGPEPARESTESWRDRIEHYQRQLEAVMDRRTVDNAERARFLRYLNALKKTH